MLRNKFGRLGASFRVRKKIEREGDPMFCPKCGTKNVDGAKFCAACGNPLPVAPGEPAPPSGKSGNPAVVPDAVPGAAPVPQGAVPMPVKAPGTKKKIPIIIGAAAAIAVIALVAVFVVIPGLNKNPFKGAQVGDKVEFGSYEQDGDTSNGKEPIEWRVLAVEGNRALVVSEKGLDAHCFNSDEGKGNEWESSDLKAWLEEDFSSEAFSDDEAKDIDGAPTLLSVDEADKYFKSNGDRVCRPTRQAVCHGVSKSGGNNACFWWLRTPAPSSRCAAYVRKNGNVYPAGNNVDGTFRAVRPALWVNLQ